MGGIETCPFLMGLLIATPVPFIDAVQAAREMPLAMPGGNNNPDGRNQYLKDTDDPKTVPVELGQVDNVNLTKKQKGGNRKEYLLKRLSRDFPQALDRIQSGEISTRKAAIEYGIVKVKTPMRISETFWNFFIETYLRKEVPTKLWCLNI